ncbi:MAG: hypothetical protein JSS10_09150 [Verrucomicrobia bacterium]|nr:hypothetical protein [Verrucomicrobiota bacterium]
MAIHAGWTKTRSFLESGVIRLPLGMASLVGATAAGELAYRALRAGLQTISLAWGNQTPIDQNPLFTVVGNKAPQVAYKILESVRPFRNNDLENLAWKVGIGALCGVVLWDLFDRVSKTPDNVYTLGLRVLTPFDLTARGDRLMARTSLGAAHSGASVTTITT